jgi:hypothetical protein
MGVLVRLSGSEDHASTQASQEKGSNSCGASRTTHKVPGGTRSKVKGVASGVLRRYTNALET